MLARDPIATPHTMLASADEASPCSSTGGGNSPFPDALQKRTPPTGAVVVGWGKTTPATAARVKPTTFKRRTTAIPTSLASLAEATQHRRRMVSSAAGEHAPLPLTQVTPTTEHAMSSFSTDGDDVFDRKIDEKIVKVIAEQEQMQTTINALSVLNQRSRRLSGESSSSDERTPECTPPSSSKAGSGAHDSPALEEWEARKRHDHASRLMRASANASKAAARRMLAMATNEELRISARPRRPEDRFAATDIILPPSCDDTPQPPSALNDFLFESTTKAASAEGELSHYELSEEWNDGTLDGNPWSASGHHAVKSLPWSLRCESDRYAASASPWQCFVHGLFGVLGCTVPNL